MYWEAKHRQFQYLKDWTPSISASRILQFLTLFNLVQTNLHHPTLHECLPVMDEIRLLQRYFHLCLASLQNLIVVCLDGIGKGCRTLGDRHNDTNEVRRVLQRIVQALATICGIHRISDEIWGWEFWTISRIGQCKNAKTYEVSWDGLHLHRASSFLLYYPTSSTFPNRSDSPLG